jgi:hypothetical protein
MIALEWSANFEEFVTLPGNGRGVAEPVFQLYFVRSVSDSPGIAVTRHDVSTLRHEDADRLLSFGYYVDNAFVNEAADVTPFTPSHELLHLMLLHGDLDSGGHSSNKTHLIKGGTTPQDTVTASKRITQDQESEIYDHPFVEELQ